MSDKPKERIYSVIEYYANKSKIGGGKAFVKGFVGRNSNADCFLSGDGLALDFDAASLSEEDHITILRNDVNTSKKSACIELNFKTGQAVAESIKFD